MAGAGAEAEGAVERLARSVFARRDLGDDGVDVVLLKSRELGDGIERDAPAVDPRRRAPELAGRLQHVFVKALAAAHDRRQQLAAAGAEILLQAIPDLPARLRMDGAITARAVLLAHLGVEQAKIVVDLGDRRDGRFPAAAAGALLDRDGRRNAEQQLDVRLGEHLEKLTRVGRQAVDVAPLALGVDDVEGESRLSGPGKPRDDDDRVARNVDRDVTEVVLLGADHADETVVVAA